MSDITSQLSTALADRYRIERHLGEGGMAIVYLAHDVRHDRRVALKVLRPELAAVIGAERFLNEIKVTANLQHPHILPLHDSGDAGSFLYYVMPYIEGDTLRDKLNRERQLAIEDAIEITRSIASALDYAHRQEVIHRDIKPENVLMHDGQPLIADFGIALAVSHASGQRLTETGLSLGTPHYMSPEQAMGDRELDARSDVYSLGAMLYEMLAGEPPYQGSTAQAIVAKVITEKAPMVTAARDTVPPHINAAIAKALNKMPADRFGTAAAFADALANPAFSIPSTAVVGAPQVPRERRKGWQAALLAAAAGVTLMVGFIGGRASAPEPAARLTRFVVPAPEGVREYDRCCASSVALSPDGQWLVFVGVGGGEGRSPLYRRHISQLEAEEIPGTDNAGSPFFSPDSRWVGFGADGRLRKVPIAGGPPVTIVEASRANSEQPVDGASWGDNDVIVLSDGNTLHTVPAGGGGQLTVVPNTEGRAYILPTMLPGGTAAIARANGYGQRPDEGRLVAIDLETGATDTVGFGTYGAYAMGHLLFSGADGTLLAQPFNPGRRRTTGSAVALFDGLALAGPGVGEFAVSRQGGLAFQPGTGAGAERLVLSRPDGAVTIPLPQGGELEHPAFSPDGERIALHLGDVGETADIWIYDLDQRTMFRLTVEGTAHYTPVWTRDGSRVAFTSNRGDGVRDALYWKAADGSGTAQLLLRADYDVYPGSWFPDDRTLAIVRERNDNLDIGFLTIGDSTPRWILESPFDERQPHVSPDGRWLAYTSDRSGRPEVYVQAIDGPGPVSQVSTNGGSAPRWGPNGNVLFYADSETNQIVAAAVTTRDGFRVTNRTPTGTDITDLSRYHPNYDIHPDGEGLLVISQGNFEGGPPALVWVLDWPEMMREVEANR